MGPVKDPFGGTFIQPLPEYEKNRLMMYIDALFGSVGLFLSLLATWIDGITALFTFIFLMSVVMLYIAYIRLERERNMAKKRLAPIDGESVRT